VVVAKGKRLRSELGSIEDLGNGRYRVVLSAGWSPDGKKRLKFDETIRGTRKDAQMLLARFALKAGKSATALKNLTVYEFVREAWLPTKADLRPSSYHGYELTVENHIKSLFGNVKLAGLLPYTVSQRLGEIENKGAAKNVYKVLRNAMKYAAQTGFLDNDPMPSVTCPKVPKYDARVLTADEMFAVLDYFRGDLIEPAVLVALSCGLRRSEICGLDWQDIKLPKGGRCELEVKRGYHGKRDDKGEEVFEDPKSERSNRTVSIPGFAARRLLEIRGATPRIGAFLNGPSGKRMSPDTLTGRWRVMMGQRLGRDKKTPTHTPPVDYLPFKNLRHTHATITLSTGVNIVDVSRRLGHSSVSVTDTFYLRPGRASDDAAADAFDALGKKNLHKRGKRIG